MTLSLARSLLAGVAILSVAACTDPGRLDPNAANANRDQGVLLGAGVGAALGNLIGGNTEATLIGAAVGGLAGGITGNQLDKQEAALRSQVGNDDITIVNTGDKLIVSLPQDITFDTDSFGVRQSLQPELSKVADNLIAYPNSTVQVIGHTDNEGDAGYNQGLSERRAIAVASLLQAGGVASGRIQTIGQGENLPVASNLTEEGRAQNRRVEIVVLPNAV